MMRSLVEAGMSVARLNFSHGTHAEHQELIRKLKSVREEMQVPLAIMLDTKGPEIRLGSLQEKTLQLHPGHRWLLTKEPIEGDAQRVHITPPWIIDKLLVGMRILFDDGYISSRVIEVGPHGATIEIENEGVIRSGKGVNIPDSYMDLPAFTEKDIDDIRFGCREHVDIIAASFVRSADHVLAIKRLLDEENSGHILVVAKIENSEGVENFDSIVQVADGIMIARGDLGVEVPLSQVPRLQKMMIRKCYLAGKPSVTATQMLESMINNPRPTRAEASDVANAIYDSTSAVMLSGETAVGKYPIEVVKMMCNIVNEAENDFDYRNFFNYHASFIYHDVPSALTLAAVKTAYSSGAKAIFAFTSSGKTARLLSRLRPSIPILAMTPDKQTYQQLAFNWGVIPFLTTECGTVAEAYALLSALAVEQKIVTNGDLVVVTAGSPFGVTGTTNMMIVESIGNVLVRGETGIGSRLHGKVAIALTPEAQQPYSIRGSILVLATCNEEYLPLIKEAAGIILQNHIDDIASEKYVLKVAEELKKTAIVRADAAINILKEGQLITIDPEKALVYKGVVM